MCGACFSFFLFILSDGDDQSSMVNSSNQSRMSTRRSSMVDLIDDANVSSSFNTVNNVFMLPTTTAAPPSVTGAMFHANRGTVDVGNYGLPKADGPGRMHTVDL